MILSEIFKIAPLTNLTRDDIENILNKKYKQVIKWAIVRTNKEFTEVLVSFEKIF